MTLILKQEELKNCVSISIEGIKVIEDAFKNLSEGNAIMPPIMRLDIEENNGEVINILTVRDNGIRLELKKDKNKFQKCIGNIKENLNYDIDQIKVDGVKLFSKAKAYINGLNADPGCLKA